jgi:hypothetical protein
MLDRLRHLPAVALGLFSAPRSLVNRPNSAGYTRHGQMCSFAWEGWWDEELGRD